MKGDQKRDGQNKILNEAGNHYGQTAGNELIHGDPGIDHHPQIANMQIG